MNDGPTDNRDIAISFNNDLDQTREDPNTRTYKEDTYAPEKSLNMLSMRQEESDSEIDIPAETRRGANRCVTRNENEQEV